MSSEERNQRFSNLAKVPLFAAVDHRYFLNKDGTDQRLETLSRNDRRRLKVEAKRLALAYNKILDAIRQSGAGYPTDKLLRELAVEYTYRYATSGIYTQPISFNYFEAFCNINLIENSVAPYAQPVSEVDHLFSVVDYFDYITSPDSAGFHPAQLMTLPEGRVFHFSTNGSVLDFTYLTSEGREFVIAGFSMVRRSNSLHWYVLGGELLSEMEWRARVDDSLELEQKYISPNKRLFLSERIERDGSKQGAPIALEGTGTAIRTIIAGETDLVTCKHTGRCHMSENEHAFTMTCDDPEVFTSITDPSERMTIIEIMRTRVESAAVMWDLAEALFQLPAYFAFKVSVAKSIAVAGGRQVPINRAKGGRGVGTRFRHVSAIEFADQDVPTIRSYTAPHYQVETEGYWRRVSPGAYGRDAQGNQVRGRTWVKSTNKWRERPSGLRTIFIKSSIAAAKIKAEEYVARAEALEKNAEMNAAATPEAHGVLYVLRCTVMKDEIFKVGWTSGTAQERAKELSSATGVPSSFVVVDSWAHPDPAALEKGVHAMLDPYRINEGREFFQANYVTIKGIIEAEIARTDVKGAEGPRQPQF